MHPANDPARKQCVWLGIIESKNVGELDRFVETVQVICTGIDTIAGPAHQQSNEKKEGAARARIRHFWQRE